jgi:dihydrolipoamide dehydrogenase
MADASFDVIVVGGGPGGYVAAIRASQLGLKVGLVEREHLGGICLNWGCIPTKALLRSAEIGHLLDRLGEFGFSADNVRFDLAAIVKRSRQVARRLNGGVKHLLKKNEVTVLDGHARLAGAGNLVVTTADGEAAWRAPHIVLATGARARSLPGLESDGERIWTYKEAMLPDAMPASLVVIGSGAIGMEFASFYADLGAVVTVVEMLPRILPSEDPEIAAVARQAFEKRGLAIHTAARVGSIARSGDGVVVNVVPEHGERFDVAADRALLAVGITGNVEDVGLESTAVEVEAGHIVTNEWMETAEPGIYAIGDVAGPPWLAHKASHEGVLCAERIAGESGLRPLDVSKVPACTYCRPQVASVGLTEEAAVAAGRTVRVGRFPFRANGKALAMGDADGLVKTVFDAGTGELLGAHMVGAEVTELIQGYAIARTLESTEAELIESIFPHPTLSEAMHEAVLDAFGRTLNL